MPWFAKLVKTPEVGSNISPFWKVGRFYLVRRKYTDNDKFIVVEDSHGENRTVTKREAEDIFDKRIQKEGWTELLELVIAEDLKDILRKGS